MASHFTDNLLAWYRRNARDLPWRGHPSPYAIWVSEIMLQQTRVETVIPYFERWMMRFPTIDDLARAPLQDVLSTWEGLGYYSRARNLHRAAQVVVEQYGGELPADPKILRRLPGIGRYTAGAIASMAFGLDEPVLDGNVRRVYARVFNVSEPARSPSGERILWQLAADHLPARLAGDYNQALMDLGAQICTPRNPACLLCPIREDCEAYRLGIQEERPVMEAKPAVPHITVTAAVILRDGKVLIAQRPEEGLLGGMWEFPGGKVEPGEELPACLAREICEELNVEVRVGDQIGIFQHAYTHFRVTLHAFWCTLDNRQQPEAVQVNDLKWISPGDLKNFPMGKIDRQISTQVIASLT